MTAPAPTAILVAPPPDEPIAFTTEAIACRNVRRAPGAHAGVWTADVQVIVEATGPHGERLLGERVMRLRLYPQDSP